MLHFYNYYIRLGTKFFIKTRKSDLNKLIVTQGKDQSVIEKTKN